MNSAHIIQAAALPIGAYLCGSIPWGLLLTRMFASVDVRQSGSGNIGATNVRRLAGTTLGLLTLAGDFLKGALPVYLAVLLVGRQGGWSEIFICLVALAAFCGHLYPVFLKFKSGGKGVATAAGCFAVLSPAGCLVAVLVFIMLICWCNRASAGSLGAAATLPTAVWKSTGSGIVTACAVITVILIYLRHRENIKRLFSGREPVIWDKKA